MSAIGFDLDELVQAHRLNAALAWVLVTVAALLAVWQAAVGRYAGALLTAAAVALLAAPGPFYRSYDTTLPWEVVAVATVTVAWNAAAPGVASFYATAAAGSLVAVLDLHLFTGARMSHRVAAGMVAVGTAAVAGAWVALRWGLVGLGYPVLPDQGAITAELLAAAIAGVVAALAFEAYVVGWEARLDRFTPLLEGER